MHVLRLSLLALALLLVTSSASWAVSFSFEGTTPDTGVDVFFTADLTISGDILTIVLTNDSLNHTSGASPSLNPNDVLTSFYFSVVDLDDGLTQPMMTYASAAGDVCLTSSTATDDCSVPDENNNAIPGDLRAFVAGDDAWQFRDGLDWQVGGSQVLTFGMGTAGNGTFGGTTPIGGGDNGFAGNIVDGMDFGIYAGDVTTSNLNNRELVNKTITFMFSGLTGFSGADIVNQALFGLGTKPDSFALVPEPGLLMGLGVAGLAWYVRRRRQRPFRW